MRARSDIARRWEAENPNPAMYGSAGMGAQRAAWAAALEAETGVGTNRVHAQASVDLVKAFEMIPHQKLADAAASRDYPLKLLRLSLAAYRLKRSVGFEGVFGECVRATRGITAGSNLATTELRVLLIDLIASLQERWPPASGVRLTLYVDDPTISASGTNEEVAEKVARIMTLVTHVLEDTLKLSISTKSQLWWHRVRAPLP